MKEIPVAISQKFWRWTILRELSPQRGHRRVKCQCECGTVKSRNLQSIRSGLSRSCGCLRSDAVKRHGMWKSTEYTIWSQMKQRCYNQRSPSYHKYGARGIGVCKRWKASFAAFLEDMGNRPSMAHTLDRFPNNNGNYEPGNCRWATIDQQAQNKRPDVWKRIVCLLAGDIANEVIQMVADHRQDIEISRHIAATYLPNRISAH